MIRDEEAARKVLAQINKESQELLQRAAALEDKLNDLQRFFRQDAQNYSSYGNASNIRTASSELNYVTRSFPKFLSYLKRLANYAYPLIIAEDEDEDDESEQSSPNKIDKNVRVVKPTIEAEAPESLEESDG